VSDTESDFEDEVDYGYEPSFPDPSKFSHISEEEIYGGEPSTISPVAIIPAEGTTSSHIAVMETELTQPKGIEASVAETTSEGVAVEFREPSTLPEGGATTEAEKALTLPVEEVTAEAGDASTWPGEEATTKAEEVRVESPTISTLPA